LIVSARGNRSFIVKRSVELFAGQPDRVGEVNAPEVGREEVRALEGGPAEVRALEGGLEETVVSAPAPAQRGLRSADRRLG
jgi:hypothetical protein